MKNMGPAHSAWCVGSKMAWRGRLVRLDWSGGPDNESDKMNLMKNMGLDHSDWRVVSRMARGGRLVRLDQLSGPNGNRAVRVD